MGVTVGACRRPWEKAYVECSSQESKETPDGRDLKPFEWGRIGKALDLYLLDVLHQCSAWGEVSEWVQKNCNYKERRAWTLMMLEDDFGRLSCFEQAQLFGETPQSIRKTESRLSEKLRQQFSYLLEDNR
jgi:hypothetical protein